MWQRNLYFWAALILGELPWGKLSLISRGLELEFAYKITLRGDDHSTSRIGMVRPIRLTAPHPP
jgi:hypothetical protein